MCNCVLLLLQELLVHTNKSSCADGLQLCRTGATCSTKVLISLLWHGRRDDALTVHAQIGCLQVKYADPQALRAGTRGTPPLAPSGDASVRSDSNDSILQRRSALRDPGARQC